MRRRQGPTCSRVCRKASVAPAWAHDSSVLSSLSSCKHLPKLTFLLTQTDEVRLETGSLALHRIAQKSSCSASVRSGLKRSTSLHPSASGFLHFQASRLRQHGESVDAVNSVAQQQLQPVSPRDTHTQTETKLNLNLDSSLARLSVKPHQLDESWTSWNSSEAEANVQKSGRKIRSLTTLSLPKSPWPECTGGAITGRVRTSADFKNSTSHCVFVYYDRLACVLATTKTALAISLLA